jgi:DNA helicase II / ATP-dependent DNA helicase PcrA
MSNFKPSIYQQGIYDFLTEGKGNAVVSAVAGSGKTTTLINALNLIPSELNVLFLAFNKSIAQELSERVPRSATNIEVRTLHAYGYFSLTKSHKSEIDNNKYKKLLRDIQMYSEMFDLEHLKKYNFKPQIIKMIDDFMFDDTEKELIEDKIAYFNRVMKLTDLGRLNLIDLKIQDNGIDQLKELSEKHNVEIINGECYRAWLLINIGASYLEKADFTDMVFLPNYLNLQTTKYDIVFIDECQDLNSCQRELMKKAIKPNTGRFIAVGDEKQAIYGFAGADSDSFQKLIDIPNTITLPLSVCYRCGSDIIDYVKKLMPTIEASPNAKKGLIDKNFSYKNIVKGDMVICRNTMPLVSLCMKYLSQGVKAFVMGTDISASLITMIESCRKKTEEFSCENIFARIYKEKNKLVKNVMNKEKCTEQEAQENNLVISFTDKIQTLETLSSGCITGDDLIDKLKKIFSDDADGICLSTIHKSKGLEADRVFIIHEELMPSKHAKKDWEKVQEKNLMYVAYTRAKSVLGFVTDFDAYSNHESKEDVNAEIKESNFVGVVGDKVKTKLTIMLIKEMNTSWGDTTLYEMVDDNGNLFSKFGDIPERFLISNHAEVEVGSIVEFNATIKAHKDFKGIKTNVISHISKA